MRVTTILLSATLCGAATASAATPLTQNGLLVGANTEVGSSDKEGIVSWKRADSVKSVLGREFGLVQTTAYPAWDTWKGSGIGSVTFDMTNPNKVIDFAKAQGKKVAVHLMTGSPTYFPAWLNEGSWTPAELEGLLERWISYAATTNGNASKVDYWNVVNEAFMWNGYYWDSSSAANTNPWQKMGWEEDKSGLTGSAKVYARHPVYIRKAFELARKYAPGAKLELRDYGIEQWEPTTRKTKVFYQLVKHLLNSGVPIDAVGLQGHFRTDVNYDWNKLRTAVSEYRKLGLEVYLTEVDYGDADPVAASTAAHRTADFDSAQSRQFRAMATAAVAGGVKWICLWGVADNTNAYWRMGQSALLFDENYRRKPTVEAFRQGILDGLALATSTAPRPGAAAERVRLRDGVLRVSDPSIGEVELRAPDGAVAARVRLGRGEGRVPSVPSGVYAVRACGNGAPIGFVTIL